MAELPKEKPLERSEGYHEYKKRSYQYIVCYTNSNLKGKDNGDE
jgi:hypothetical protein